MYLLRAETAVGKREEVGSRIFLVTNFQFPDST
jgi:hypothetical protein